MNLKDYLQQDRQWKRDQRIGHARYMLTKAVTEQDKQFWRDVISANEEDLTMRQMKIKAVIVTDGTKYLIHGGSEQTSQEMFKTLSPLWGFDPATETAHYIELEVTLPQLED